ncbi:MAG: class I SAM-dependent methyltransferase [Spirochaetales bacterium]|nr:class I SAM-dependent methyltransferase [Spirochaetales bacterium]
MKDDNKLKSELQKEIDKDSFRKRLTRFTWQAYNKIPTIKEPKILDIGCGSGIPTIDLAVLSKGKITAVDIDGKALNLLKDKIKALYLTDHITLVRRSMTKLRFKKDYFDIIWAEGSIAVIGFEQGLKDWYRFLKPGGYLVVHDSLLNYNESVRLISTFNYTLVHHFIISEQVWYEEYFKPLGKCISDLQVKYSKNYRIMKLLEEESVEIEQFKESPKDFASVFYVMQKVS